MPTETRIGSTLRRIFERTFILNGGYDLHGENDAIARDEADLIAFGVPFLAKTCQSASGRMRRLTSRT